MLISYNWLQKYFKEPLPAVSDLADTLTMGIFEIDAVNEYVSLDSACKDTILDVKVLPDRAPYCLSHRYIAKEISSLLDMDFVLPDMSDFDEDSSVDRVNVSVEDSELCPRYSARLIKNVSIGTSPEWLKLALESLGQRSINNIVDLTNYAMLECGQPLHAFDADKVKGNISIRKAKSEEKITILGGIEVELPTGALVVSDDAGALAIAGVKGGQRAEIDASTKNIILESACFNRTSVRKTSQLVGIRNESSKRFENGVTPERAGLGMALFTSLLCDISGKSTSAISGLNMKIGEVTDIYPNPIQPKTFEVAVDRITQRLGVDISQEKIIKILEKNDVAVSIDGNVLTCTVPEYRTDLNIAEDIAEEVGRIYGYDKIEGTVSDKKIDILENKNFYYQNLLRKKLIDGGFTEVYTYSLTDNGDIAVQNPLTVDRAFMRNSIADLMSKKFLFNMKNIDLLGLKEIKLFEIGKVFGGDSEAVSSIDDSVLKDIKERYSVAIGLARSKQPKGLDAKEEIRKIAQDALLFMGLEEGQASKIISKASFSEIKGDAQTPCVGSVIEFNLDEVVSELALFGVKSGAQLSLEKFEEIGLPQISKNKFQKISPYPFSVRDIAVFLPGEKGQEQSVEEVISEALSQIGKEALLVRKTLFDVFTKNKEGEPVKTSYAYRLVFQSFEKTLSEEEINECMKAIADACVKRGFEVR